MFGRTDINIIILIILMAILCAIAGALAYYFLEGRPDAQQGAYETVVEDQIILVDADANKLVKIISTPDPAIMAATMTRVAEGTGGSSATATVQNVIAVTPITPIPTYTPVTVVATQPVATVPAVSQPIATQPVPVQPLPATLPAQGNEVILQTYTVVPGDTLYRLTVKFNTTIALMAQYGIDATDIISGNVLQVPVANPAHCPGSYPYVVNEGNTLYSIARKCGTTVNVLMQLNGFNSGSALRINDVICVPNPP